MPEFLVEVAFRGGQVVKGFYVTAPTATDAARQTRAAHPDAGIERVVEVAEGRDEVGRPRPDPEAGRL